MKNINWTVIIKKWIPGGKHRVNTQNVRNLLSCQRGKRKETFHKEIFIERLPRARHRLPPPMRKQNKTKTGQRQQKETKGSWKKLRELSSLR